MSVKMNDFAIIYFLNILNICIIRCKYYQMQMDYYVNTHPLNKNFAFDALIFFKDFSFTFVKTVFFQVYNTCSQRRHKVNCLSTVPLLLLYFNYNASYI